LIDTWEHRYPCSTTRRLFAFIIEKGKTNNINRCYVSSASVACIPLHIQLLTVYFNYKFMTNLSSVCLTSYGYSRKHNFKNKRMRLTGNEISIYLYNQQHVRLYFSFLYFLYLKGINATIELKCIAWRTVDSKLWKCYRTWSQKCIISSSSVHQKEGHTLLPTAFAVVTTYPDGYLHWAICLYLRSGAQAVCPVCPQIGWRRSIIISLKLKHMPKFCTKLYRYLSKLRKSILK
jgi:hypothetical protein